MVPFCFWLFQVVSFRVFDYDWYPCILSSMCIVPFCYPNVSQMSNYKGTTPRSQKSNLFVGKVIGQRFFSKECSFGYFLKFQTMFCSNILIMF